MVVVEDIDVLETHAPQALIETRQEILSRSEVTVGAGPHVPAGFRGNDELVAQGREILGQNAPEIDLGTAIGRVVVVREIEVGDPEVKCPSKNRSLGVDGSIVAKIVPESGRNRGRKEAAAPAASIRHGVVAGSRRHVLQHRPSVALLTSES